MHCRLQTYKGYTVLSINLLSLQRVMLSHFCLRTVLVRNYLIVLFLNGVLRFYRNFEVNFVKEYKFCFILKFSFHVATTHVKMADVLDLNAEEFVEEDDGNKNAFTFAKIQTCNQHVSMDVNSSIISGLLSIVNH